MAHDYSRFTKRIAIKAPVTVIYELWATQTGLERWFLRSAPYTSTDKTGRDPNEYATVNDTYEWKWHGWGDEAIERGTVLEANGIDSFKFTFGKAGNVTVSIKEHDGLTICELLQDNIPTDEETTWNFFIGCQTGWTFYLTNLKSILEGGIDLRNRDEKLGAVVNS
jgi:uncharacterized protein YndB with AHSA1/START domain